MYTEQRILHVVTVSFSLPYFIGDQFIYFGNKGVRFFVASSPSDHFIRYSKEMNFTPLPIDIKRAIDPIGDLKAIIKLRKFIKTNNIDLIIGHTPKGGLIGMAAAFLAGKKNRIYFRHGLMFETAHGIKRFLLKNIERISGILAKKVICVSNSILIESIKDKLNDKSKNILLGRGTCNGVNGEKFHRASVSKERINEIKDLLEISLNDFVVGFVGRLVNDKGISELIKAWEIIMNSNRNVKLLLIGPFEERDALPDFIKNVILNEDSIICTGLIEDIKDYYAVMNMIILPSYREGFPTVILEGSSMELPVVTTRATGCRDAIIENETGIFCTFNPEDISRAISFFINNDEEAKRMGKNGRNFVLNYFDEKYIWNEIEKKIMSI